MPKRACMTVGASNYGMADDGTFVGDDPNTLHIEAMCEWQGTGNDADEEMLGENLGTDYTTHAEAEERGSVPTTDRERNRGSYIESQTTEKSNATLIVGGLVLYYLFGGF